MSMSSLSFQEREAWNTSVISLEFGIEYEMPGNTDKRDVVHAGFLVDNGLSE